MGRGPEAPAVKGPVGKRPREGVGPGADTRRQWRNQPATQDPPHVCSAAPPGATAQPALPFPSPVPSADFTGYWALAKHEQMDDFLRAAGFPWVVRKAALKFGGGSIDVVAHTGSTLRVTSLNAKGSWTRTYDVEWEVSQKNAEGTLCKTTSWWEGGCGDAGCLRAVTAGAPPCPALAACAQFTMTTQHTCPLAACARHPPWLPARFAGRVFRSRLEGSPLGVVESWRYLRGSSMAVRTSLRPAAGGPEAVMFWFFDRMETLQRQVARGGSASLLQKIEAGARGEC